MKAKRNIVGLRVQQIRLKKKLNQEELAAKCGVLGWDISRGTLAKIESQIRCINDYELWILAKALHVKLEELYSTDYD